MNNEAKNRKIFGILCLAVSLVAVSFAYMTLTHTLKVKASDSNLYNTKYWDIRFENLKKAVKVGDAIENVAPTIMSDIKIGNYEVTFFTPGDEITYKFDIVNEGRFDAIISSVNLTRPSCRGNSIDCYNILNNIEYTLTYSDGKEIKYGDILYNKFSKEGSNRKKLKLTLKYSEDTSKDEIPKSYVTLENMEAIIICVQKNIR